MNRKFIHIMTNAPEGLIKYQRQVTGAGKPQL
jgi:hypothetical protein